MFEPTHQQIEDKELELVLAKIVELDSFKQPMLAEAIGNDNGTLIKVLLEFAIATSNDDKLWCHDKFLEALKSYFKLADVAENALIVEVGNVVRIDVDDYKFVPHDARY
jgi:hypothetical protein